MTGAPPPLPGQQPPPGPDRPPPEASAAPPPLASPGAMPAPPPLGDPEARPTLHSTEVTRTYPCHACGAQLVFDPASGGLRCRSCGTKAEIQAPTGHRIVKHDLHQAMRALHAAELPPTLEREVVCQACGGKTAFTGTLTATRCPYCNTPVQRDDLTDVASRLPIDGMLPFRVDEKSARDNIEKWINSRWFAPKEFKTYREIGSFESIYLAYFSFDAHARATYSGRRGEDYQVQVRDGDQTRTETRTHWHNVSGQVREEFYDVTAWANRGLDENRVAALEPWPLAEAVPYSPEYVAGHLGRTYDLDADETFNTRTRGTLEAQVENTIRRDIGGDKQQITSRDIRFDAISFAHLLLPIWLLTVTYAGKPYQVLMNGVTGEVQGARPWSKVKIALFVTAMVILVAVIVAIVQLTR
ncbi:MAG: hypothetical protein Q4F67_05940 [Propionibacteriaceae bacterium]|nr:hypothetical protein [Propionibacteriaceae bacterium]